MWNEIQTAAAGTDGLTDLVALADYATIFGLLESEYNICNFLWVSKAQNFCPMKFISVLINGCKRSLRFCEQSKYPNLRVIRTTTLRKGNSLLRSVGHCLIFMKTDQWIVRFVSQPIRTFLSS